MNTVSNGPQIWQITAGISQVTAFHHNILRVSASDEERARFCRLVCSRLRLK